MGGEYQPVLVTVSVLIAIIASYTALDLAGSVWLARGRARFAWLAGGSFALGTGIWSMHFIGMLSFHMPGAPISYEITLLIASVLVAILASAVALITVSSIAVGRPALLIGGLSMGVAIAGMHYTGMAAIRMPANIEWSGVLVAASVGIAVAASLAALRLALRFRQNASSDARWLKIGAGVIMGFAIAGMHYTGMAAATFVLRPEHVFDRNESVMATSGLATAVAGTTLLILAIAVGGSIISREMRRRSTLTDEIERLYGQSQRELSAKHEAEQKLRESEEYFRALIENASDLILVLDENGLRRYASPSYARLLGFAPTDLLNRSAFDHVHPEDVMSARIAFRDLLNSAGGTATLEMRVRHADGSWRTLHAFGQNLLDNQAVRGVVVTARDETERLKLEAQYRQAQKMEAVGRLAGGVAHDFNNLLTVIEGAVHFLANDDLASQAQRDELAEIHSSAQRAAGLTRQLLAFSRQQVLQPRVLKLNSVVDDVLNLLRRLLGEHIDVGVNVQPDLWPIRADRGQIEQIIMNLAVNSRDAMPQGGALLIKTRNVTTTVGEIALHEELPPGEYVILAVSDTGTGMNAETIQRMFEPFFTTKEQGKGTGLGLATVYGIVKQSGGHISVKSSPGHGADFQLYFPRTYATIPKPVAVPIPSPREGGSETILLVEDEAPLRALVERVLKRAGYQVLSAGDGDAAIAISKSFTEPIHLLLTDVVLPGWNGREIADRIHALRPDIQVLFTSGYTDDEVLHRGVQRDGIRFLEKPFTPDVLLSAVRGVLTETMI